MTIQEILQEPDGSLDNVEINLDFLTPEERYNTLSKILSKIQKGGNITISGIDLTTLNTIITLELINNVINSSKSIDYMANVERYLINQQFTITKRQIIDNAKFILSARY